MKYQTVKDWLLSCKAFNVQAVTVTIGSEVFQGCRYTQEFEYTPGMDCVTRGQKKVGDKYQETGIYLLGALPKSYRRSSHVCFPFDGLDWYIAGYYPEKSKNSIPDQFAEFHPFGANFMIKPWNIPDSRIDQYEPKPYTRIAMSITVNP